ncbi:MAG: ABC transporter substrate-binding protein [Caldilineaceae bacterium]
MLRFLKINDELEAQAFAKIVEAWHQTEGGKWSYVTIEYDAKPFAELFPAISQAVATDSQIDLIQADGPDVKHFAYNNVLMDLTDSFTEEELQTWAPQSVAEGSANGRFYGPPLAQSCQLMWYRADAMTEAGIDVNSSEGWTLGDDGTALQNWLKLTTDENGDGSPEVFGLAFSGPWDYFQRGPVRSNGAPGDPTFEGVGNNGLQFTGYFDSPESIEAWKFMQSLVTEHGVQSAEQTANQMLTGLAATQVYQDLIMGTQKDQFPDVEMGAIEPPYFQTKLCQTGSWHYGIAANTRHFDEALSFVKFAASDEGARIMYEFKSQLPANVNLLNELTDFQEIPERVLMKEFFTEHGVPRIESPAYTEYNALFTEFYVSLIAGADAEALAQEYAQLMDQAAAKYEGWNE